MVICPDSDRYLAGYGSSGNGGVDYEYVNAVND
jgi:hypothetical protein